MQEEKEALKRLAIVIAVVAMAAGIAAPVSAAKPGADSIKSASDNLSSPLADKQAALKQTALQNVLNGKASPKGKDKVVKVAPGQFVQLAFQGEDQILTVLGQFGNSINPVTGGTPGPLHNQIPQPDRSLDNTTIWAPDFNKPYYESLLYDKSLVPSMANWYLQQSSGTYSVDGMVGDWVTVPFNEARYGTNLCGSIICSTVWSFVNSSSDAWWNDLVTATGSVAAANAALAPFDVWDRYDSDGDGNFNEPDGYIDHFQSIHAGVGEETGGGAQGTDAIWSHRWYAYFSANGPDGAGPHAFGGIRIGASNYWIGDYTIEPENGGVGVFAHEFGHDLGLPDEYDTSGNTGGAENSTAWWTNWSQGSYGTIDQEGLGMYPVSMTSFEKLYLGWLDYTLAFAGDSATYTLGPLEYKTKKPQALIVLLPDKFVTTNIGSAYAGSYFYHSGAGNNLDNNMTRPITLGGGPITLSLQGRWQTETCWDYWYVEVSTDGGATFHSVPTSASTADNENSQNFGNGITGTSGSPKVCDALGTPVWTPVTADLSAYAGSTIQLRFRYWTDGAVVGTGVSLDDIAITGQTTDGAETDPGWAYHGFVRTTGDVVTGPFQNFYLVENRTFNAYDLALKLGPYNFTSATMVEHFSNQPGMLVWYYDSSFSDNNVGDHPGGGLILPVDSHPAIETWTGGTQMRPRIQSYDSTFTKTATHAITLHNPADGVAKTIASKPANSVFNDSLRDGDGTSIYWAPGDPSDAPGNTRYQAEWNSVNVPNTGTVIRLKSISSTGEMIVDLNK